MLKEIFSRGAEPNENNDKKEEPVEQLNATPEFITESPTASMKKKARWRTTEVRDLIKYFKQGMTLEQLAATFNKSVGSVIECLQKNGVYEQ